MNMNNIFLIDKAFPTSEGTINMISLCNSWEFTPEWTAEFLEGKGEAEKVRIPHTVKEIPIHYAGPEDYEIICGYRRSLDIPEDYMGKRLFLQFDGAAHIATVYINGVEAATHRCGYMAFRVEITELVNYGGENALAVKLDSTENSTIPPFGFVIDYLTYGGLYREVWLDVRDQIYIEDIYVTTPDLKRANVKLVINGEAEPRQVQVRIMDGDKCLTEKIQYAKKNGHTEFNITVPDVESWDIENPKLYTCHVLLMNNENVVTDSKSVLFGFRTAEFKADGFYLNGKHIFLRGLNRHQNYPYVGYAATEHLQREDARILKEELQCNAVRTSHYPQSKHFIDECDRRGILVFTELPGWQHIGDEAWKEQAYENVREMVLQYRNHPSIIIWGVRINESHDDDELYRRTNAIAHELDPSRSTSGVRYMEKSSLLEDVYSYNDFSHTGDNPGVKPKNTVTPDMSRALIVTEHNGHMFPTKSFDPWQKRQEHALRHGRVLDAAMASGEHAGCFGWCMFDYPTHKDFGSGDRVCYHGVMDVFRNPKLAAALYASQGDGRPVLEVGSPMDIGDYPGGKIGTTYIFSNADEVELYKNENYVKTFRPHGWSGLKHGPIPIDDMIGCLLETQEDYLPKQAKLLKECLNAVSEYGIANLPLKYKLKMLLCMKKCRISFDRALELYSKYVGNWGDEAIVWRFDAKKKGKTVASCFRGPGKKLHVEAIPSQTMLCEGNAYDMAAVRIRILDEHNNLASYAQLPVQLSLEGAAELVGPSVVTAEGGMCGTYLRTIGKPGRATLCISTGQTDSVSIEFEVN
jgi:beta-galactosidase